jgi:hypothetical protein
VSAIAPMFARSGMPEVLVKESMVLDNVESAFLRDALDDSRAEIVSSDWVSYILAPRV